MRRMGSSALHHRNLALLLSLGAIPACPGSGSDTSDSGTGTSEGTTTTSGSTSGSTSGDVTDGGSGSGSSGPSVTTGMTSTEGTSSSSGTTGDPLEVPPFCVSYAAKFVECVPMYAPMQPEIEYACAMYASYFQTDKPDCAPLFEELMVCFSSLSCADLLMEGACADQQMKLDTCVEGA